ncbi:down syndrome cell adhesion molecule [Caerostris extrusa]|uniref:Down syndrome cell adhesion molecule n=1 Tax=Caerostris extrusa TaxID=172846 RepID=A0AAV4Y2Q9_CAEEX|nr:down syndrome cell adhesion molecule [Caerostris extrusa]
MSCSLFLCHQRLVFFLQPSPTCPPIRSWRGARTHPHLPSPVRHRPPGFLRGDHLPGANWSLFLRQKEEKRYKAAVPGGPDRRYSYCGSSTLPHPRSYKDVDKNRPLLRIPGVPMPPLPPPEGYPAPYATMPIRCGSAITTERRRPSEECRIVVGKNGMLHHATMDRKRMAGLTIQETAEVHHYDMAA